MCCKGINLRKAYYAKIMNFKITEHKVMGVLHPGIICKGWVGSNFKKVVLRCDNDVFFEETLSPFNDHISYFKLETSLTKGTYFQLLAYDNKDNYHILMEFKTSLLQRLKNKLTASISTSFKSAEPPSSFDVSDKESYLGWLTRNEFFSPKEKYNYQPLISIVIPVYNVAANLLSECLDSILNQTYPIFEVCISDDCSTNVETIEVLKKYEALDSRIKVVYRKENGHISKATNSALELACGEFIGLIDNDDLLVKHALNEVVRVLNHNFSLDFIYTDEDKIGLDGRREYPHFKSDFAPESFYGGNYICHFSVVRKEILDKIGGFRDGYVGAQDFDLFLRICSQTEKIYHIPRLLYRWRMIPSSTALDSGSKNYAADAGKRALEDFFHSKNIDAKIHICLNTNYFVEFSVPPASSLELMILFTGDRDNLQDCILFHVSRCPEQITSITVINTSSNESFTNSMLGNVHLHTLILRDKLQVTALLNQYLLHSVSKYFAFISDDTRIQTENWANLLIGYASQPQIGLVAGKIHNLNDEISESGIVLTKSGDLIPANLPYHKTSYGVYGRLAVPFNYSVLNNKCYLVENAKFQKAGGFDESFDYSSAPFDLALNMRNQNLRNVFIPQVIALCAQSQNAVVISPDNKSKLFNKWQHFYEHDPYYNENFSQFVAFELEK